MDINIKWLTPFFAFLLDVLLGWRLAKLAPLLRHGKLMIVSAAEARYYGLSGEEPFVCDIVVTSAQREPADA